MNGVKLGVKYQYTFESCITDMKKPSEIIQACETYVYKAPYWAREARIIMMDKGITGRQIADALEVKEQYVANVLTGYQPSKKLARRICEYLKIQYDPAV